MSDQMNVDAMKKHVLNYSKPNDQKAWLQLGVSVGIELIAIILIHINMKILGWGLHNLNIIRLFVQFHDMAHFSYFQSITLNKFIGVILGIYTHFPYTAWRDGHNHHHKHFGNLDRLDLSQTILFTKKQYDQMKGVKKIVVRIARQPIIFFLITSPFVWFVGIFVRIVMKYGLFSTVFLQKVVSIVFYTWICPLMGIPALNMWITVYITNIIGTMLFHIQHSVNLPYREHQTVWNFTKAALQGSTYFLVPIFFKSFTNGIQYHHIHHLNTNVPSYNIQSCHFDLENSDKQGRGWDKFHINRVDLKTALISLNNVMLDEENNQLIPFSYNLMQNNEKK